MQFQQKGLPFYLYEFPRRVTNYRFQILFSRSISRFLYSAIGKADKVAGVRVMEADFAGKAAYIGNFQ